MPYLGASPLARCTDVQSILDWLLQTGIDLSQTSLGNIQLMNWKAGCLRIRAQRGFDEGFLKFFERVRIEDGSACARALRNREAIVIEDIMTDEEFSACRKIVSHAGVRAVQPTPILSSSGALLGVMSTHFIANHRPTRIELRELQYAAQLAADALINTKISRRSVCTQIGRSVMLLERAQEAMSRADQLIRSTREFLR
jgi:GAF domain-containing protein